MTTIADTFLEVARGILPPILFNQIHNEAAWRLREASVDQEAPIPALTPPPPPQPARKAYEPRPIATPDILARSVAKMNNQPPPAPTQPPHVVSRMDERLEVQVTTDDLNEIMQLIQSGDSRVRLLRTFMHRVEECMIIWRGREFIVVWNRSTRRLVTAYPKEKKRTRPNVLKQDQEVYRRVSRSQLRHSLNREDALAD